MRCSCYGEKHGLSSSCAPDGIQQPQSQDTGGDEGEPGGDDDPHHLVTVERYANGSYEPLAEMAYDSLLTLKAKRVSDGVRVGQRVRLMMWVVGQPVTTTYTADPLKPGRVLVAADGTTTRRYLYGMGMVGEYDGVWSYQPYVVCVLCAHTTYPPWSQ